MAFEKEKNNMKVIKYLSEYYTEHDKIDDAIKWTFQSLNLTDKNGKELSSKLFKELEEHLKKKSTFDDLEKFYKKLDKLEALYQQQFAKNKNAEMISNLMEHYINNNNIDKAITYALLANDLFKNTTLLDNLVEYLENKSDFSSLEQLYTEGIKN